MATFILKDVGLFVGAYDLTGFTNKVAHNVGAEMQDETVMIHGGADTRKNKAGLITNMITAEGFVDLAALGVDSATYEGSNRPLFNQITLYDQLVTLCPDGIEEGDLAFQQLMAEALYEPGASVGELLKYKAEFAGRQAPISSTAFLPFTQQVASGASSKIQLGALSATQRLYAGLHVIQFNGTSLDIIVRSDANAAAGGETTRITMTQATTFTFEQKSVAGAITNTWWDIEWTFVGTTFTALMVLGIR